MKTFTERVGQIAAGLSALVAIVCPVCIPAVGAFLAAIGLGFAVNVGFLRPFLIALLALAVFSLAWSSRMHGRWWVIVAGLLGACGIYVGRYLWYSPWLMVVSAALLIGVSIVNFGLKASCARCERP